MAANRRQRVLERARVSLGSVVPAAFVAQIGCIRGAVPWYADLRVRPQVSQIRRSMTRKVLASLTLAALPLLAPGAAMAMPAVGDMIGTDPETAKAALERAGCPVDAVKAEDGKNEAKCTDAATGHAVEVCIDPA